MSAHAWDRRRRTKRLRCAIHHVIRHPDAMLLVNGNCIVLGINRALDLHLA